MQILKVEVPEEKKGRVTSRRTNQSMYASYSMVVMALDMMRRMTGDYCYIVEREKLFWIARVDASGKEVQWW